MRAALLLALLLVCGAARADDTAAVGSKAVPLPEPPEALAKLLKAYDAEPEPQREAKRVFASALYYLLDRNLERYLLCFHADYELEESGAIKRLPLPEHSERVKALWEKTPKPAQRLEELVLLDKARAYTREQARKWIGDWKKAPSELARVMQEGDLLVIAPLDKTAQAGDFYSEVYYVLRKQDGLWKIVLGE